MRRFKEENRRNEGKMEITIHILSMLRQRGRERERARARERGRIRENNK